MPETDDSRAPRLVVTEPADQAGSVLPLDRPHLVVGRSETADLTLTQSYISERHALITTDAQGTVTITDLNSTNGTLVNGQEVTGPLTLEDGDQVAFGDLVSRFDAASAAVKSVIYTVTGAVGTPALPGVGGLIVQLVDKNVGGDQSLATTQTAADGSFAFAVPISAAYLARHHKTTPDLQARVFAGQEFLAASAVGYSAPTPVRLDVVLPAGTTSLPSEYETLTGNIAAAYPGDLTTLQEDDERQDITYLANKTGWDARAVALAALAHQFGTITAAPAGTRTDHATTAVSLAPEFYYALFRAGFPANADSLFRTGPARVQAVWRQATAGGVIPAALADDVPAAVANFQALSAAHSLTAAPIAGPSTLAQLLAPILPGTGQQQEFARLHAQHGEDWDTFWTAAQQEFGADTTDRLRLTGQLYTLTVNNEPLVTALLRAEAAAPPASVLDLVGRGYHSAAKWAPLIGDSIPAGLPGDTTAEQAASYAELLAAQLRISYPTAVVADQVRTNVLPIADSAQVASDVAEFLSVHQADFAIGAEPVEAFLARHGVTGTPAAVITQVKRLQRVYQLTPDDTSMSVLLGHNLDSAFAITRYDQAGFARAFAGQLGGPDTAITVHTRAKQVFSATLNLAVAYLNARISPSVGGSRAPVHLGMPPQATPSGYPVTAYPTLEDLFGSLDYCDCSDCNSIFSPAAYLVDLLNYTDRPAPSTGHVNPQDALLQRRPDLEYLPLTCPNTNVELPYIDVVNELLEYFVSHGCAIDGYQGYDTGDTITSAELIAAPQHVDDAAYGVLQNSFFPPPLPFHRPLTLLRLQAQNLGVALPDAMIALRGNDQLTDDRTPGSYGWRDILIERLTISRDEYRLFTDPALQLGDLYGLPGATALDTLRASNLQDLTRRLGVTYDDVTAILLTTFLNPDAALIPRLQRLGAPFTTIKALHDNLGTPDSIAAQFIGALPAGLDATEYGGTDPADYQAVVDWVTSAQVYPRLMRLITIDNPAGDPGDCSGTDLFLRYSDPDANLLSGTDYLKLIRFILLWRKLAPLLGDPADAVTIAQTDDIIGALYPPAELPSGDDDTVDRALLDAGFATLLLRTGVLCQVMAALSLSADDSLDQLLACWAPIGTAGPASLYRRMFLTPTLSRQDPGAQIATVSPLINTGDVLHTSINGVEVTPAHTVTAGETAAAVAAAIAAAINACTTPDPVSGLPLNSRCHATSAGGVVTVKFGFTLAATTSAGATETFAVAPGNPVEQTAAVAGTVTAGDTLTSTIDGIAIGYVVAPGDTPKSIAAGIAAAVNATTIADPYSGLPLGSLVMAYPGPSDGTVTYTAVNAGAPFTLACVLDPANAGTYTATAAVATVAGTIPAGATLTTTINGLPLPYQAPAGNTPATIATAIAALVNATTTADPATGLPLNQAVHASASGGDITVSAAGPTTTVTLAASMSGGGYTAGQQNPPFADDGYGDFLGDPAQTLFGHEPALCGACNLTGAEFALITAELGFDPATPLTLANVSALFRFGWLAHTLNVSVLEFIQLRRYTGLDPFAMPDPAVTLPAQPPIIPFIALCAAMNDAGLIPAQALYLMWNQDNAGTYTPAPGVVPALATALAADFAAVEATFTRQVDPDGTIAKQLMTLVYGTSATDFFAGLLNNTVTTSVPYSVPSGQDGLPAAVLTAAGGRLSYDDLAKQLTFAGVLDAATVTAIDGAASDPALITAIAALGTATGQTVGPFFAQYPELLPLYTGYVTSTAATADRRQAVLDAFLPVLKAKRKQEQALAAITAAAGVDPAFATALLADPSILHADTEPTTPAIDDLTAIENQGLTARFYLGNDPAAAPDVTVDVVAALAYAPTATVAGTLTAGDELWTTINGVTISYPVTADDTSTALVAANIASAINATTTTDPISGLPLGQVVQASATGNVITIAGRDPSGAHGTFAVATSLSSGATETYAVAGQLPKGGAGGIAADWTGCVTVPQNGLYDIDIAADPGATVTLAVNGIAVPMAHTGGLWSNQGPISLSSGTPVPITLIATSLKTTFAVSWRTQGTGWQPIPAAALYPQALIDRLGHTYVRFLKATTLASTLSLTAAEVAYLGTATGCSVDTTAATAIAAGSAVFTPASMTNIATGTTLVIDSGAAQETVTVTATTATTFTAVAAGNHDGTATPFPIVSQARPEIGAGWLNFLIAQGTSADAGTNAALADVLTGLLDFTRIKQALSPDDERLLTVLANPSATVPGTGSTGSTVLIGLTGWSQSSVDALLTQFFGGTDPAPLGTVAGFARVHDAYAIVTASGLSAATLVSAITNAPTPTTLAALQSAQRARYAESDWLTAVTPVNNAARIAQRDALVAYIVQQLGDRYARSLVTVTTSAAAATGAGTLTLTSATGVQAGMSVSGVSVAPGTAVTAISGATVTLSQPILAALPAGTALLCAPADGLAVTDADSLYDCFLIDTQTQPPVLTSRIVLALSTVQLFVERVVRNLEPACSPSDVDVSEWQWMKRYRVWQANREVFCYPENWLYPELRDDQSPIFQQAMSGLLQGDITDDTAAAAYLSYLTGLEEVAKLEPCGLYYQPGDAGTDETAYVVARTAGARRKYYFRELTGGSWTAWTEVQIECEDLPLTPIVWNGRLFLFWLKAVKQAVPKLASVPKGDLSKDTLAGSKMGDLVDYSKANAATAGQNAVQIGAVLCWTEYYNGTWQPTKTSDAQRPTMLGTFDTGGDQSFEAQRGGYRIVPAQYSGGSLANLVFHFPFSQPAGSQFLLVTDAGGSRLGGFLLHNTHSLPVRVDDMSVTGSRFDPAKHKNDTTTLKIIDLLDPVRTTRTFAPADNPYTGAHATGAFAVTYTTEPYLAITPPKVVTNKLLDYSWSPRVVDAQPGLSDVVEAPFFYEDRRQLFYVTTTERTVPALDFAGFGILTVKDVAGTGLSGLLLRQPVTQARPAETVAANAAAGDSATLQRFLTTGATINAALPGPGAVTFGGRVINPVGSTAVPAIQQVTEQDGA